MNTESFKILDYKYNFPEIIRHEIENCKIYSNKIGCTSTPVILIKRISSNNLYLKIKSNDNDEKLFDEKEKILWLKKYLNVPEVIAYYQDKKFEYLLLSEIEGKCSFQQTENLIATIKLVANGLKKIHQIPINNCHFNNSLSNKLSLATVRVESNLVDENDFEEKYKDLNAKEILNYCKKNAPQKENLVFTHGDYCLPNIIISINKISGFIDLGRAGISDKYQDIALCYRSIIHNFKKKEYADIFLENYTDKPIDWDKIEYFIALDELF